MDDRRGTGAVYEQQAAEFLESEGYLILERNFRCRFGEIDIIARDGRYLVFAEVKYRASLRAGGPLEAVDFRKQGRISRVADCYCMRRHIMQDVPCRFDVVAVCGGEITLLRNAFEYVTR